MDFQLVDQAHGAVGVSARLSNCQYFSLSNSAVIHKIISGEQKIDGIDYITICIATVAWVHEGSNGALFLTDAYMATVNRNFQILTCSTTAFAAMQNLGIDEFPDRRDIHDYKRRHGELPAQREGDEVDYRPLLHRDGSVISSVSLDDLKSPERLYQALGTKLVVGMPFKDIATSDSILMSEPPPSTDVEGRRALKRLQEVGVHVIAPASVLAADPLPHAVALVTLQVSDFFAPDLLLSSWKQNLYDLLIRFQFSH